MDKYNQRWVMLFASKGSVNWAMTLGQTTYYSVEAGLVFPSWRRHEEKHKEQWKMEGYLKFAVKYLWYHIIDGYQNNPYEVEARKAERGLV